MGKALSGEIVAIPPACQCNTPEISRGGVRLTPAIVDVPCCFGSHLRVSPPEHSVAQPGDRSKIRIPRGLRKAWTGPEQAATANMALEAGRNEAERSDDALDGAPSWIRHEGGEGVPRLGQSCFQRSRSAGAISLRPSDIAAAAGYVAGGAAVSSGSRTEPLGIDWRRDAELEAPEDSDHGSSRSSKHGSRCGSASPVAMLPILVASDGLDEVRRHPGNNALATPTDLTSDTRFEVYDNSSVLARGRVPDNVSPVGSNPGQSSRGTVEDADVSEFCVAAPLSGRCCLRLVPQATAIGDTEEGTAEVSESCRGEPPGETCDPPGISASSDPGDYAVAGARIPLRVILN